jgi:uncharacterized membrane protein required for colicin V production
MIPNWLSLVDVTYVLVALMFAWGGYQKGFSAQLAHVLTFFTCGILLFFAYPFLFKYFGGVFRGLEETYLMWMLLITLLILGLALFILFSKMLAGLLKPQFSERADQGWGLIFGFFRGMLIGLIAMILIVMLDQSGKCFEQFRMKSQVGKLVCYQIVPRVQPRLTTLYENKVRDWKAELMKREEAGDLGEL